MANNARHESILVFGASGFIGRSVSEHLKNKGYKLITPTSKECDLLDPKRVREFCSSISTPVHVIFCAGILPHRGNSFSEMSRNMQMVQSFVEAAKDCSIRSVIYMSTADVYGFPSERITENTAVSPRGYYGLSKFAGEVIIKAVSAPVTILRLPGIYGEGDGQRSIVGLFSDRLSSGQSICIKGDGSALRDYVEISDVCSLTEKFINFPYDGILNVATGRSVSIREVVGMIGKALDIAPNISYEEDEQTTSEDLVFDTKRLKGIVSSFRFTEIEQGIGKYAGCFARQ